jgi:hypothetical protein
LATDYARGSRQIQLGNILFEMGWSYGVFNIIVSKLLTRLLTDVAPSRRAVPGSGTILWAFAPSDPETFKGEIGWGEFQPDLVAH